jgi:hypothetical protein
MDDIGAIAEKAVASPHGYDFDERTPEEIENMAQRRTEKRSSLGD